MKSTLHCGKKAVKWKTFLLLSGSMPERTSKCSPQECLRLYMTGGRIEG